MADTLDTRLKHLRSHTPQNRKKQSRTRSAVC